MARNLTTITGITVTYNSEETIAALLRSTAGQLDEHVIVDNASTDNTCREVERFPKVTLIRRSSNVGFAGAVNQALRERALDGAVLLLNPDVRATGSAIRRLAHTAEQTGNQSLVAPRLVYDDGRPQESVRTFPTVTRLAARRTAFGRTAVGKRILDTHLTIPAGPGASYVDWAIGAAMFVPRDVLDAIGPMNEKYFLYCEDVDWCLRSWRAAHGVIYAPGAVMIHSYQRASRHTWALRERTTRMHWRSMTRFAATNADLVLFGRAPSLLHGSPATSEG